MSVTDDARAEAERRYPSDVADRGLTYPTGAVREHSQAAFVAGARWAAARDEMTSDDPHDDDGNRLTPEWQPEMTTEWAHMLVGGGASIHRTREAAEQAQRDYLHQQANLYPVDDPPGPPSAGIYRREVTEWKKADQ